MHIEVLIEAQNSYFKKHNKLYQLPPIMVYFQKRDPDKMAQGRLSC